MSSIKLAHMLNDGISENKENESESISGVTSP